MSAPATKAFSPAPVMTTTSTAASESSWFRRTFQLGQHRAVERVVRLGSIDGQGGYAVSGFQQQILEFHVVLLQ